MIFEDSFCRIQDVTGQEILKVKMKGKSFSFDPIKKELVAFSTKASKTEMWHKRLGHCHLQMMQLMKTNELTVGLPTFEGHLPNCQACPYEKQKRRPFPKSTWRATCKLQLVHTDVSGPQRTPSLVGSRYYIVFIDDFTRLCWIFFFFLKFKSEVAGVFWKFKKMVENQSGCNIQVLRSDDGKEYTSEEFNLFC